MYVHHIYKSVGYIHKKQLPHIYINQETRNIESVEVL